MNDRRDIELKFLDRDKFKSYHGFKKRFVMAESEVRMSYSDYLLKSLVEKRENPNLRMGQVYFNVFSEIDPDHASFISSLPSIDCFHDDNNIGNFLYEVCVTWELRKGHHKK